MVLVGLNRDDPALHDVYRLQLSTGELEQVFDNPGFIDVLADADLQVRAALAPTEDGGVTVHVRDAEDDDWRVLFEDRHEDALGTGPLGFDRVRTSGLFVLSSVGANTSRLLRYDLATGEARCSPRTRPTTSSTSVSTPTPTRSGGSASCANGSSTADRPTT